MRKTPEGKPDKESKQSLAKQQHQKKEYLDRLKKMALYDAKNYLDITTSDGGEKKISLKADKEIDWDIVETVEISDDKVKLKFPDRSKAMEKYGKIVMCEESEDEEEDIVYIPYFKGDDDGEENGD